jgi:hypothetical protein
LNRVGPPILVLGLILAVSFPACVLGADFVDSCPQPSGGPVTNADRPACPGDETTGLVQPRPPPSPGSPGPTSPQPLARPRGYPGPEGYSSPTGPPYTVPASTPAGNTSSPPPELAHSNVQGALQSIPVPDLPAPHASPTTGPSTAVPASNPLPLRRSGARGAVHRHAASLRALSLPGALTTQLAPAGAVTAAPATVRHLMLGIGLIVALVTGAVLLVRAHPDWFPPAPS